MHIANDKRILCDITFDHAVSVSELIFFSTNMVAVDFYLGVKISSLFQLTATKFFLKILRNVIKCCQNSITDIRIVYIHSGNGALNSLV